MRFKKVLVAVDFSEPSRQAFHTGVAHAADTGAQLVLVHVTPGPRYSAEGELFPLDIGPYDTFESAKASLGEWQSQAHAAGAKLVETRVATGIAWHEIVEVLRSDRSFDLVIVGTHGRTGIQHVLLGSVAERVVRHAPCPVLVMRVPE